MSMAPTTTTDPVWLPPITEASSRAAIVARLIRANDQAMAMRRRNVMGMGTEYRRKHDEIDVLLCWLDLARP